MEFRTIAGEMSKDEYVEFQVAYFHHFRRKYIRMLLVMGPVYLLLGYLMITVVNSIALGLILIACAAYLLAYRWIGAAQVRSVFGKLFDSPQNFLRVKRAYRIFVFTAGRNIITNFYSLSSYCPKNS